MAPHWSENAEFTCPANQLKCSSINETTIASYSYCITPNLFRCRLIPQCQCPPIKAEPDIAGIGMVAAFIASATFCLASAIICLTLYSDNGLKHNNPFDRFWRRILCNPVQRFVGIERARTWSNSLFAMIMAISDQQIITGIAILSASIRALDKRTITVYHFNVIMDMAWFSSNVHLISLCVMRSFLESSNLSNVISHSRSHSLLPRSLRIVAMLVLAALLLHCSSISGYELWDDHVNCPALCITRGKRGGYPHRQMIVTYIFVIQSYTFQIARVTPSILRFCSNIIKPVLQHLDQSTSGGLEKNTFMLVLYSGMRKAAVVLWYFFTSDFEFMLEMLAWYCLGLYWTWSDRREGHKHMEEDEMWKENHIGFGQLVPVLLIVLATLAGMEAYICRDTVWNRDERRASGSTINANDLKSLPASSTEKEAS